MEKKDNEVLLIIATILITLMGSLLWYQNKTIKDYNDIINNADTAIVIKHDTLYTDIDSTATQPVIIKETIIRTDTIYSDKGDTIKTDLKKKYSKIPYKLIQLQ